MLMSNRNDITGDKIITRHGNDSEEFNAKWNEIFSERKLNTISNEERAKLLEDIKKVQIDLSKEVKVKKVVAKVEGNQSGITPVGHRVLIKPDVVEHKTESGIIVHTGQTEDRERLAQIRGVVVELGNTAFADQPTPWCKVGDRITFGKYSGLIYKGEETLDGHEYRIINDLDVVAIHKEETK